MNSSFGPSIFTVAPAEKNDANFIIESQIKMARETESIELNRAIVTAGVSALFENPHYGKYYLARTSSGEPVGCLLNTYEWSDWRNGMILWIQSVYVKESFRQQGVYKTLYAHIQNKVLKPVPGEMEYRGLRLYVDKRNSIANQTYQALGMNKEHYEMYEWMK
jgi:ribosomal protein S18 acetylase RimI-like enzyme